MMNCGYDPQPDGHYDLPPIAPADVARLHHRRRAAGHRRSWPPSVSQRRTGQGQYLSCAVHEAVAKSTELDLMNWVMRRSPLLPPDLPARGREGVGRCPTIAQTKDGRCLLTMPMGAQERGPGRRRSCSPHGHRRRRSSDAGGRGPGSAPSPAAAAVGERSARLMELVQRFVRKYTYDDSAVAGGAGGRRRVRAAAQAARERGRRALAGPRTRSPRSSTPSSGRSLTYAVSKWISTEAGWVTGRRAPLLGEDTEQVRTELSDGRSRRTRGSRRTAALASPRPAPRSPRSASRCRSRASGSSTSPGSWPRPAAPGSSPRSAPSASRSSGRPTPTPGWRRWRRSAAGRPARRRPARCRG